MAKKTLKLADVTDLIQAGAQVQVNREPVGPQQVVIEGLMEQLKAIADRRDDGLLDAVQSLAEAIKSRKKVPPENDKVLTAREIGICFGD